LQYVEIPFCFSGAVVVYLHRDNLPCIIGAED
jgi:hypothetical protein